MSAFSRKRRTHSIRALAALFTALICFLRRSRPPDRKLSPALLFYFILNCNLRALCVTWVVLVLHLVSLPHAGSLCGHFHPFYCFNFNIFNILKMKTLKMKVGLKAFTYTVVLVRTFNQRTFKKCQRFVLEQPANSSGTWQNSLTYANISSYKLTWANPRFSWDSVLNLN